MVKSTTSLHSNFDFLQRVMRFSRLSTPENLNVTGTITAGVEVDSETEFRKRCQVRISFVCLVLTTMRTRNCSLR